MRLYIIGLVAVLVLSAAVGIIFERQQSIEDARDTALADAQFGSNQAARDLTAGIELIRTTVASTAGNAGIGEAFARPEACTLTFGGSGGVSTGHLDLVRTDGVVICSSLTEDLNVSYADEAWYRASLEKPRLAGPVTDPRTGAPSLLLTSPIPKLGMVVAFVDLDQLGPTMAKSFGGRRKLEFVVTTADGARVLTRSIDPRDWSNKDISATEFAKAAGTAEHVDLDGKDRLYGTATVKDLGWKVHAGADQQGALGAATAVQRREVMILLVGLLLALVAAMVVYRRLARPIGQLSAEVRAASAGANVPTVTVAGPREVEHLAEAFNTMGESVNRELVQRRFAEDQLRTSEATYRLLFDSNPQPMWVSERTTDTFIAVNEAAVAHYGYTRDEFLSMRTAELEPTPDSRPPMPDQIGETDPAGPTRHITRDGRHIDVLLIADDIEFDGQPAQLVAALDVTERERLQRQVHQAQRLESLGQLAGGVAHDFNNLLAVILNYSAFIRTDLAEGAAGDSARWETSRADVEQITLAAERATRLTHQLLAFARREVVQPTVLNLNDIVADVEELLRRSIGEHVQLQTSLDPELWPVKADAGQIEQVLVNLAVNARDAMPAGGILSIDTHNVEVDESYAAGRPGLSTGPYVRIRVGDTGTGMDPAVAARAFDPFFTTKESGDGSGLGLATVYGIITQAGGVALLYSEPGYGTTVTALFPITDQAPVERPLKAAPVPAAHGETILVVEDEPALREVTRRILERNGYSVLLAEGGAEAIELCTNHATTIHLLLTDVIMPQMLGKDVAREVSSRRPDIRVLYMSGYAQPMLDSTGGLDPGVILLEKPFSDHQLLTAVHTALDRAARTGSPAATPGAE